MRAFFAGVVALWCEWTHGGGWIMRDPSGRVNWQCQKCGRWAEPVPDHEEYAMTAQDMEIAEAMREVGRRIGH